MVKALFKFSIHVNIDAQDHLGRTPLHAAVVRHDTEIRDLLLEYGARDDIADHGGNTVADLLQRKRRQLQEPDSLTTSDTEKADGDSSGPWENRMDLLQQLEHTLANNGRGLKGRQPRAKADANDGADPANKPKKVPLPRLAPSGGGKKKPKRASPKGGYALPSNFSAEEHTCDETGGWQVTEDDMLPCGIDEVQADEFTAKEWCVCVSHSDLQCRPFACL